MPAKILKLKQVAANLDSVLLSAISEEISFLTRQYRPKTRQRRCLYCQTSFKSHNDNHVWCSASCARNAHYLKFRVSAIRGNK